MTITTKGLEIAEPAWGVTGVKVGVTGAGGFVGSALVPWLAGRGHAVTPLARRGGGGPAYAADALAGLDAVVHLAGRAHVMDEPPQTALQAHRRANVEGTRAIVEAAAQAAVRRVVFVSTVKVHGERSGQRPFTEQDPPAPQDAYAASKHEAEQLLWSQAAQSGLEGVVVRPPLVYGPGMKGNLRRLVPLLRRGVPLPLAGVDNRRSLIGLGNLCDALAACVEHPGVAGETFLVSDGVDLSTPELLRHMARALGREARLVSVPERWLRAAAALVGRREEVARLCDSLAVDIDHARQALGWTPPESVAEGWARAFG